MNKIRKQDKATQQIRVTMKSKVEGFLMKWRVKVFIISIVLTVSIVCIALVSPHVLYTTLQLSGLFFDFFGAIILALSEIMSRTKIKKMAGTYVGSNPHLEKYLEDRNFCVILATILLTIGFALQFAAIFTALLPK